MDVRNKHFLILLHNFKGIYAVLSRIWKCCKSRVFVANFLGRKIRLVLYFLLFATMDLRELKYQILDFHQLEKKRKIKHQPNFLPNKLAPKTRN